MINNESGFLSKKLLIIISLILVLLAGGVFAYLKFFSSGKSAPPADAHASADAHAPAPDAHAPAADAHGQSPTEHSSAPSEGGHGSAGSANPNSSIFDLDTFIVNLLDDSGRRYLKLTIKLELGSPLMEEEINQKMPEIRDNILILLSSKSYESIAETAGKIRLRTEIISRVNNILTSGKINKVYFTEFVIQ